MARGGRLPRTAGRPPRFLRTDHRRAIGLSEIHLRAARRRSSVRPRVSLNRLFHRASRGVPAQRATFRVLAEGDPDVDAALASAMGCSPLPRSLTPPRPPLSDQKGPSTRGCGTAQIVRKRKPPHACLGLLRCLLLRERGSLGLLRRGVLVLAVAASIRGAASWANAIVSSSETRPNKFVRCRRWHGLGRSLLLREVAGRRVPGVGD